MGMELILSGVVLFFERLSSRWAGLKKRETFATTDELNEAKRQTQNQTRKADEVAEKLESPSPNSIGFKAS